MLELMPSKKIIKAKKEELEANLILFGLILVLILSVITAWHILYKKSQSKTIDVSYAISQSLLDKTDLNGDGQIDEKDAKLIKESFFKNDSGSLKADLNGDDKVDGKDYSLFNKIVNLKEKETNAAK